MEHINISPRGAANKARAKYFFKDWAGKKIGQLTIEGEGVNKDNHIEWVCRCDCGRTVRKSPSHLVGERVKTCGMCPKPPRVDHSGKKIHRLTLLQLIGADSTGRQMYKAKCDCGGLRDVVYGNLRNGSVLECRECARRGRTAKAAATKAAKKAATQKGGEGRKVAPPPAPEAAYADMPAWMRGF